MNRGTQLKLKRSFDIVFSIAAIVVLLPVMLLTALLIKIFLGSPVFFAQRRPGKNESIFTMYKFRSMSSQVDAQGQLLPDELRLPRFGKFLRSTSLDELPELFNILRGNMSFVGPRPLLIEYLSKYNEIQRKRHDVLPGLTGLAQVMGRNTLEWERRFDLDVWYVENWNLLLDFKILLATVKVVFSRSGISYEDSATMFKFEGAPKHK